MVGLWAIINIVAGQYICYLKDCLPDTPGDISLFVHCCVWWGLLNDSWRVGGVVCVRKTPRVLANLSLDQVRDGHTTIGDFFFLARSLSRVDLLSKSLINNGQPEKKTNTRMNMDRRTTGKNKNIIFTPSGELFVRQTYIYNYIGHIYIPFNIRETGGVWVGLGKRDSTVYKGRAVVSLSVCVCFDNPWHMRHPEKDDGRRMEDMKTDRTEEKQDNHRDVFALQWN